MSVNEISLPVGNRGFIFTHQTLGTIAMICSPLLYLASFFYSPNYNEPPQNQFFASLGGFLYLAGIMASAIAMRQLRITGKGKGGAILFGAQIAGLILAMMFDILSFVAPHLKQTAFFFVTDMAYPFSHLLMIIVGVAIVRAGVWRGWQRIPAFLCGSALPLFFASSAVFGRENSGWIFIGGVTLGFFLLGYAVSNTKIDSEK